MPPRRNKNAKYKPSAVQLLSPDELANMNKAYTNIKLATAHDIAIKNQPKQEKKLINKIFTNSERAHYNSVYNKINNRLSEQKRQEKLISKVPASDVPIPKAPIKMPEAVKKTDPALKAAQREQHTYTPDMSKPKMKPINNLQGEIAKSYNNKPAPSKPGPAPKPKHIKPVNAGVYNELAKRVNDAIKAQGTYHPNMKKPILKPVNTGVYGEINNRIKEADELKKAAQREQHTYAPVINKSPIKPVNTGVYGEIKKNIHEATIIKKAAQREQHTYEPDMSKPKLKAVNTGVYGEISKRMKEPKTIQVATAVQPVAPELPKAVVKPTMLSRLRKRQPAIIKSNISHQAPVLTGTDSAFKRVWSKARQDATALAARTAAAEKDSRSPAEETAKLTNIVKTHPRLNKLAKSGWNPKMEKNKNYKYNKIFKDEHYKFEEAMGRKILYNLGETNPLNKKEAKNMSDDRVRKFNTQPPDSPPEDKTPISDKMTSAQKFMAALFGKDTTARQAAILNGHDYNTRDHYNMLPYQKKYDPNNADREYTPFEQGAHSLMSKQDKSPITYDGKYGYDPNFKAIGNYVSAAGEAVTAAGHPVAGTAMQVAGNVGGDIAAEWYKGYQARQNRAYDYVKNSAEGPAQYKYDSDLDKIITNKKFELEQLKTKFEKRIEREKEEWEGMEMPGDYEDGMNYRATKKEWDEAKNALDKKYAEQEQQKANTPLNKNIRTLNELNTKYGVQYAQYTLDKILPHDEKTRLYNAKMDHSQARNRWKLHKTTNEIQRLSTEAELRARQHSDEQEPLRWKIEDRQLETNNYNSRVDKQNAIHRLKTNKKRLEIDKTNLESQDYRSKTELVNAKFQNETQPWQNEISKKALQKQYEGTVLQTTHDRMLNIAKTRQDQHSAMLKFYNNFQNYRSSMAMFETMKELDNKQAIDKMKEWKQKAKKKKKSKKEFEKMHRDALIAQGMAQALAKKDMDDQVNTKEHYYVNGKVNEAAVDPRLIEPLKLYLRGLSPLGVKQVSEEKDPGKGMPDEFGIAATDIDKSLYAKEAREKLNHLLNANRGYKNERLKLSEEEIDRLSRGNDKSVDAENKASYTLSMFPDYWDSLVQQANARANKFSKAIKFTGVATSAIAAWLAGKAGLEKEVAEIGLQLFKDSDIFSGMKKEAAAEKINYDKKFEENQAERIKYLDESGKLQSRWSPLVVIHNWMNKYVTPSDVPVGDLDKFMGTELGFYPSKFKDNDAIDNDSWRKKLALSLDSDGKLTSNLESGMTNAREAAARVNMIIDLATDDATENKLDLTSDELDRQIDTMLFAPKDLFDKSVSNRIREKAINKAGRFIQGGIKLSGHVFKNLDEMRVLDREKYEALMKEKQKLYIGTAREQSEARMQIDLARKYKIIDEPDTSNPDNLMNQYAKNSLQDRGRNRLIASVASRIHDTGIPRVEDFDRYMKEYGNEYIGDSGTFENLSKPNGMLNFTNRTNDLVAGWKWFAEAEGIPLSSDTSYDERETSNGHGGLDSTLDLNKKYEEALKKITRHHVGKSGEPIKGPELFPYRETMSAAKILLNRHHTKAIDFFNALEEKKLTSYFNRFNAEEADKLLSDPDSDFDPFFDKLSKDRFNFRMIKNSRGIQAIMKSIDPDMRPLKKNMFLRTRIGLIGKDPSFTKLIRTLNQAPPYELASYVNDFDRRTSYSEYKQRFDNLQTSHNKRMKKSRKPAVNSVTFDRPNDVSDDTYNINRVLPDEMKLRPVKYNDDGTLYKKPLDEGEAANMQAKYYNEVKIGKINRVRVRHRTPERRKDAYIDVCNKVIEKKYNPIITAIRNEREQLKEEYKDVVSVNDYVSQRGNEYFEKFQENDKKLRKQHGLQKKEQKDLEDRVNSMSFDKAEFNDSDYDEYEQ